MLIPSENTFARAVELWREWNSRINVISRKDEDNIFAHHILHSLAISRYLEIYYPSALPSATGKGPVSDPQGADCTGIARPKPIAVLDIDSKDLATFDSTDALWLEKICKLV